MVTYSKLRTNPKQFLAMTSLTVTEFDKLCPAFQTEYAKKYPAHLTQEGQPRQRGVGGGCTGQLKSIEEKLLFILTYHKTYPTQTVQGQLFGLSQSHTNEWIHRLMPLLQNALTRLGYSPMRDPQAVRKYHPVEQLVPSLLIDGTERRRQRPKQAEKQRDLYSGKKKAHTEKNLMLGDEQTHQVAYLSTTYGGRLHDKSIADQESIRYPPHTTLIKDTGFQGYEPAGVHTIQPKKQMRGQWLSAVDRVANRLIAQARIVMEHILAGVKRCRIVKDVLRMTKEGISDMVMAIACGLHNLRNDFRRLASPKYRLNSYFR